MKQHSIAIVGCGVAGLAAAIFLARAGHDVRLFEKFDKPKPLGTGLLLQPTGIAVLAELGLAEKAISQGRRITCLQGRLTNDGPEIFSLNYNDLHDGLFGVGIQRTSLFNILLAAVRKLKIPIQTSTEITNGVAQIDGNIILRDATDAEYGPYEIVIAADGANSLLRHAHGEIRRDKPYKYGALWGVVNALDFDGDCLMQRYRVAQKMMGVLPLGNGGKGPAKAALFWSARTKDFAAIKSAGLDQWRNEAIALWPDAKPLLDQFRNFDELAEARYSDTSLMGFSEGRIVFLGDSAHVTSPQLGQGANMALLDASALAQGLARTGTIADALQFLELNRRAQTNFYCRASRWTTPFFQSDNLLTAVFRDLLFPLMGRNKFARSEMLRTLAGMKTGIFRHLPPEYFVYEGDA